jgi:hypothetical protein
MISFLQATFQSFNDSSIPTLPARDNFVFTTTASSTTSPTRTPGSSAYNVGWYEFYNAFKCPEVAVSQCRSKKKMVFIQKRVTIVGADVVKPIVLWRNINLVSRLFRARGNTQNHHPITTSTKLEH